MKSSIVQEAKDDVAKQLLQIKDTRPWYVRFLLNLFDTVSVVVLLTLAVIGAEALLKSTVGTEVKLAIAIGLVLLIGARLVERAFAVKR